MTTNAPLSLFISSRMQELATERQAVQQALAQYQLYGWLWESDAGARPQSIRSTYLEEVAACDIYLGFFWRGYGAYTIEEYEHARQHHKPCLIYLKPATADERDPPLQQFLAELQQVTNPQGLTPYRFETTEQLAAQVQHDVLHLLTTEFRQQRQQPEFVAPVPAPVTQITATGFGGIAAGSIGTFNQHIHGSDDKPKV